ncbi:cell division protein FtsZ [Sediminibacterium sp.]|uniref:cell division protein FtsZ n=1 Tax=Sediminibacterium sp. TaxID=1917865 RepID=UPI000BD8AE15|nr:cell division protein FtsZ [Sediminibacterium sp.]MDP3392487.1 cell division protein FtsZ [Sediminibacterium sp.]MDP3565753.1 cell division protein FtsZ [Sediminibacterium sp.]OYW80917.1 MAG: cell division protein FtsZ [Sphingobacteriia bacterium 32-37-4]OYZ00937.1 MAG: cell division protein FtsZ [Sphingobacteriia bacterium 28-36-52]
MIHFDLPKQKSSIIKVLGVGGGGSNAVNFMFEQDIEGVDFIICNTDAKAIEQSKVPNKIQLGPHLTQGLGAGANPEVGKRATEESLEEIKRILEVNTKMAFITVGMGGGTGTGGAPIIAQICKDLGILTVGIVTTPFGFEGPRRQLQAEEGIKALKPYVDTLLVISNDKLRMQYGNLKMKEAFSKADNVLATAAKCITDVINSRGHIIVDFADVCTVMKNGGVAILGKAEVEGENRAQIAIEEALSSPLLNDSDIRGAKWILININSAEGEHECTMDELEIINNHLRLQAGEDADVIVGMGYEQSLDKKIGITLVATGFEHKDPFAKPAAEAKQEAKPEKIVMTLKVEHPAVKSGIITATTSAEAVEKPATVAPVDSNAPTFETLEIPSAPQTIVFDITPPIEPAAAEAVAEIDTVEEVVSMGVYMETPAITEAELELMPTLQGPPEVHIFDEVEDLAPIPTAIHSNFATGFLNKPANIYASATSSASQEPNEPSKPETPAQPIIQPKPEPIYSAPVVPPTPPTTQTPPPPVAEDENQFDMQLVEKPEGYNTPVTGPVAAAPDAACAGGDYMDDVEEQKRRAAERIQKLRNLSFNVNNTADMNGEFDAVPAYVRRNMELFGNTLTSVENFYSKYTVGKDENNQTQINTINTFLDGKKPD